MRKIKRKGDSYLRDALIVLGITLTAGLLMGLVFQMTKESIEKASEDGKQKAYRIVFESGKNFETNENLKKKLEESIELLENYNLQNNIINDAAEVTDEKGERLGYAIVVTSNNGYGGAISMTLGINKEKTITGLEIISMNETPGLGAKCSEDEFKDQFKGIPAQELIVTKDGKSKDNEIDAISGATVTSDAVVGAINSAIIFIEQFESEIGG